MKIYVGNLHINASETQIKDLFKEFGNVEVQVMMDDAGKSKGYAVVHINERENGEKAIRALHRQNFMNQFLEVNEVGAKGNEPRPQSQRKKDDSNSSNN